MYMDNGHYDVGRRLSSLRRGLALASLALVTSLITGCFSDETDGSGTPAKSAGFSVGGIASGLVHAGLSLTNGVDTLAVAANATSFVFPILLASGATYAVTIASQPADSHCSLANASGTVGSAAVTSVQVTCTALTQTVGGTITGLTTAGLRLSNGNEVISPAANASSFAFPTAVNEGATYSVAITTQPANLTCSLGNPSGTVGTVPVTSVSVTCAPVAQTVGGTISGLTAAGLILSNGTDTVAPAANATSFVFPHPVAEGANYLVSVQTPPGGLTCLITGGSGTVGTKPVITVQVNCSPPAGFLVGANITGLTAAGLVLANGTDTFSPAANATVFTFPTPVATGAAYSITVQTQPAGQVCGVVGVYPQVMGLSDATNHIVTCVPTPAFPILAGKESCPATDIYSLNIDSTGVGANLTNTSTIVADAAGNVFQTGGAQTVRKVSPAGVVTTIAGAINQMGNVNGKGLAAMFNTPYGLTVDAAGGLLATETDDVRTIANDGTVGTLAGGATGGFANGTGTAAQFLGPVGIAVDAVGNAYVADQSNYAIRKITPAGVTTTLAGNPLAAGVLDGVGGAAHFANPWGMTIDAAGNLYVTERNAEVIRKIAPDGTVTTLAGVDGAHGGGAGFADGTGSAARFNGPGNLTIDAGGNLFVIDQNDEAIRKVTPAGVVTTVAIMTGYDQGFSPVPPAGLTLPVQVVGITISPTGAGYIAVGCAIEKIGL